MFAHRYVLNVSIWMACYPQIKELGDEDAQIMQNKVYNLIAYVMDMRSLQLLSGWSHTSSTGSEEEK